MDMQLTAAAILAFVSLAMGLNFAVIFPQLIRKRAYGSALLSTTFAATSILAGLVAASI